MAREQAGPYVRPRVGGGIPAGILTAGGPRTWPRPCGVVCRRVVCCNAREHRYRSPQRAGELVSRGASRAPTRPWEGGASDGHAAPRRTLSRAGPRVALTGFLVVPERRGGRSNNTRPGPSPAGRWPGATSSRLSCVRSRHAGARPNRAERRTTAGHRKRGPATVGHGQARSRDQATTGPGSRFGSGHPVPTSARRGRSAGVAARWTPTTSTGVRVANPDSAAGRHGERLGGPACNGDAPGAAGRAASGPKNLKRETSPAREVP